MEKNVISNTKEGNSSINEISDLLSQDGIIHDFTEFLSFLKENFLIEIFHNENEIKSFWESLIKLCRNKVDKEIAIRKLEELLSDSLISNDNELRKTIQGNSSIEKKENKDLDEIDHDNKLKIEEIYISNPIKYLQKIPVLNLIYLRKINIDQYKQFDLNEINKISERINLSLYETILILLIASNNIDTIKDDISINNLLIDLNKEKTADLLSNIDQLILNSDNTTSLNIFIPKNSEQIISDMNKFDQSIKEYNFLISNQITRIFEDLNIFIKENILYSSNEIDNILNSTNLKNNESFAFEKIKNIKSEMISNLFKGLNASIEKIFDVKEFNEHIRINTEKQITYFEYLSFNYLNTLQRYKSLEEDFKKLLEQYSEKINKEEKLLSYQQGFDFIKQELLSKIESLDKNLIEKEDSILYYKIKEGEYSNEIKNYKDEINGLNIKISLLKEKLEKKESEYNFMLNEIDSNLKSGNNNQKEMKNYSNEQKIREEINLEQKVKINSFKIEDENEVQGDEIHLDSLTNYISLAEEKKEKLKKFDLDTYSYMLNLEKSVINQIKKHHKLNLDCSIMDRNSNLGKDLNLININEEILSEKKSLIKELKDSLIVNMILKEIIKRTSINEINIDSILDSAIDRIEMSFNSSKKIDLSNTIEIMIKDHLKEITTNKFEKSSGYLHLISDSSNIEVLEKLKVDIQNVINVEQENFSKNNNLRLSEIKHSLENKQDGEKLNQNSNIAFSLNEIRFSNVGMNIISKEIKKKEELKKNNFKLVDISTEENKFMPIEEKQNEFEYDNDDNNDLFDKADDNQNNDDYEFKSPFQIAKNRITRNDQNNDYTDDDIFEKKVENVIDENNYNINLSMNEKLNNRNTEMSYIENYLQQSNLNENEDFDYNNRMTHYVKNNDNNFMFAKNDAIENKHGKHQSVYELNTNSFNIESYNKINENILRISKLKKDVEENKKKNNLIRTHIKNQKTISDIKLIFSLSKDYVLYDYLDLSNRKEIKELSLKFREDINKYEIFSDYISEIKENKNSQKVLYITSRFLNILRVKDYSVKLRINLNLIDKITMSILNSNLLCFHFKDDSNRKTNKEKTDDLIIETFKRMEIIQYFRDLYKIQKFESSNIKIKIKFADNFKINKNGKQVNFIVGKSSVNFIASDIGNAKKLGYLDYYSRGTFFSAFELKLIVISDVGLMVFNDSKDPNPKIIPIISSEITKVEKKKYDRDFCFEIKRLGTNVKSECFSCKSKEDLNSWLSEIENLKSQYYIKNKIG